MTAIDRVFHWIYRIRLNFYADKKHDELMGRKEWWRKLLTLYKQIKTQIR